MTICPIPLVVPEVFNQYPQGYYPFEESPAKIPPKVRKPPYLQVQFCQNITIFCQEIIILEAHKTHFLHKCRVDAILKLHLDTI